MINSMVCQCRITIAINTMSFGKGEKYPTEKNCLPGLKLFRLTF